ncbi:MAG: hypothetical protein PHQ59_01655 [Candidatus Daviesbacteria bacterium]|nr:hypothetical protein [Candidatus Daviesbacteria bacterium]
MKLDQVKTALSVGIFTAVAHIGWSFLVWMQLAQSLMDKIYELHFLNNPFNVLSFDITTAATLAAVTFVIGGVLGWFFAIIWNQLVGKK